MFKGYIIIEIPSNLSHNSECMLLNVSRLAHLGNYIIEPIYIGKIRKPNTYIKKQFTEILDHFTEITERKTWIERLFNFCKVALTKS